MTIQQPLVLTSIGVVANLPSGDTLKNPEDQSFTYNGSELTQVSTPTGTITLTYNGGKLATVYDTKTGKTATFTYNGDSLSAITIS